jgi:hypothetical protein
VTDVTWKKIESKITYFADVICKEYNKVERTASFNKAKLAKICESYNKYNKEIHKLMLGHSLKNFDVPSAEISDRIDRHKVAAAFLASIIEVQPMQTNVKGASTDVRTANELLAFLVGCYIIVAFANTANKGIQKISTPKCQDEDYRKHFVKTIYRLKLLFEKRNFDTAVLFLISHIFFLLEQCWQKGTDC